MYRKFQNAVLQGRLIRASYLKLMSIVDWLLSYMLSLPFIKDFIVACFKIIVTSNHEQTRSIDCLWMGTRANKYPADLWIYSEIIYSTKPDIIIECGTDRGGTTTFLASLCDLFGNGSVISIDVESVKRPQHPRIQYLHGSSTQKEITGIFEDQINSAKNVLVILDSDHSKEHVLNELRLYSKFIKKGNYLIVEDTLLNGHPVLNSFGPGPMEAVNEFLLENKDFIVDKNCEKFLMSLNPRGYLMRVR